MAIITENNATYKIHTFEILKEGIHKHTGREFYLVKDLKAKKYKYQIIELEHKGKYFHSFGSVATEKEAYEWWERYTKRYS